LTAIYPLIGTSAKQEFRQTTKSPAASRGKILFSFRLSLQSFHRGGPARIIETHSPVSRLLVRPFGFPGNGNLFLCRRVWYFETALSRGSSIASSAAEVDRDNLWCPNVEQRVGFAHPEL
jgi:hypothetical protein